MAGFRHCSWCSGRGCMCCDAEQQKWEKAERERKEREAAEDPRDKLARLTRIRSFAGMISFFSRAEEEAFEAKLDAEIAVAEAACDAEYKRQFPDGPTPIFTARAGNVKDGELFEQVFHADHLLQAFGPGGGGIAQILAKAETARSQQDPPIDYKPIGMDDTAPAPSFEAGEAPAQPE